MAGTETAVPVAFILWVKSVVGWISDDQGNCDFVFTVVTENPKSSLDNIVPHFSASTLKWLSVIVVSIGSDKQMWSKIVTSLNKEICQLIISLCHSWAPHVEWFCNHCVILVFQIEVWVIGMIVIDLSRFCYGRLFGWKLFWKLLTINVITDHSLQQWSKYPVALMFY